LTGDSPTLEGVIGNLKTLRDVAVKTYAKHPSPHRTEEEGWTVASYLAAIDELESELAATIRLPEDAPERLMKEKRARNVLANALYYRGRLDLESGRIGVFRKKVGEKEVHWAPTELSRLADRLANEPLRQIYKRTEALVRDQQREEAVPERR
jgi:hypothetical protein